MAFGHVYINLQQIKRLVTLIIPISVCGANSQNTHNLSSLKISED